jgi:hypothetical protein
LGGANEKTPAAPLTTGIGRATLTVWDRARRVGIRTMDLGRAGHVAVIAGPAKALGAAVTRAFAAESCNLVLLGHAVMAIEPVAAASRRGGTSPRRATMTLAPARKPRRGRRVI